MKYEIEIISSSIRDLKKLPKNILVEIDKIILALADNPRPDGCKKLVGSDNRYRVRIRDYRIIYEIRDNVLTIIILKVSHRRDVYKK